MRDFCTFIYQLKLYFMKKLFQFMALAITCLALAACGNDPEKEDASIALDVQIQNYVEAAVTITPTDLTTPYYFSYFETEELEGLTADNMADTLTAWLQDEIEFYNLFVEEPYTISDFVISGKQSTTLKSLAQSAEYTFVAFYIDTVNVKPIGKAITAVAKTESLPKSDNKITLAYNAETGELDITTTNNDPYYVMVISEEYYNTYVDYGYDDPGILVDDIEYQAEASGYEPEDYLFQGSMSYDFNADYGGLEAGTYYALAGCYRSGFIVSDIAKIKFDFAGSDEPVAVGVAKVKSHKVATKTLKGAKIINFKK